MKDQIETKQFESAGSSLNSSVSAVALLFYGHHEFLRGSMLLLYVIVTRIFIFLHFCGLSTAYMKIELQKKMLESARNILG